MTNIVTSSQGEIEIAPKELEHIYTISSRMPSEYGDKFEGIPSFTRLYEEYNDCLLTQQTELSKEAVLEGVSALQGEFDRDTSGVEYGFRPEYYGLSREAQFFKLLIERQIVFVKDGVVYNSPIKGVW